MPRKKSSTRTRSRSRSRRSGKKIRVGVVGVGRGRSFVTMADNVGMELVAICDTWEEKLNEVGKRFDLPTYTDFDEFLSHDMDAVILANYFHQHAPYAVKTLNAGLHVMSETTACSTLAEAVALVRAVEKSGKTYMLAENYCFFAYNQEMRRLYQKGEIGELQFAECEYNHPFSAEDADALSPGTHHWRNWIPSTYYCTHALGPILYITEHRPVSVNALAIPFSDQDTQRPARVNDPGSSILVRLDNDAVVNVFGLTLRGHSVWYRLHGSSGLMENLRTHGDEHKLRIVHEPWDRSKRTPAEMIYEPEFPTHAQKARSAGHRGGDFFTSLLFAESIRSGQPPILDVYRSLDMSIVGIQAWRSCLADGAPAEIPDFRSESARRKYAKDDWSPFPDETGKRAADAPPPSIKGIHKPPAEAVQRARKVWKKIGYTGR